MFCSTPDWDIYEWANLEWRTVLRLELGQKFARPAGVRSFGVGEP